MHNVDAVLEGQVIRLTCGSCHGDITVPARDMLWVDGFNDFIQKHLHP